ncbi:MAG: HAD-IA family hydrolase [Bacteroides sp.]|nr:HAD-IA family hydrolase [Bacteroides sp.]
MRASDKEVLLRLRYFFFDLDGTLADSMADVLGGIEQAYLKLGWTYDKSKLRIGPLLPDIVATISPQLDAVQQEEVIQAFRAIYAAEKYRRTVLFAGVRDFLQTLKAQGKMLYVATNKPKKPTFEILEKLGIKDLFSFVGTPDFEGGNLSKADVLLAVARQFDIVREEAVMVGDTNGDIEAGKAAGMYTMAFTGGYGGEEFNRKNNADFVIGSFAELLDKNK